MGAFGFILPLGTLYMYVDSSSESFAALVCSCYVMIMVVIFCFIDATVLGMATLH